MKNKANPPDFYVKKKKQVKTSKQLLHLRQVLFR